MATARLDPHGFGRGADPLMHMVGGRKPVAPPFRLSDRILFRRGSVGHANRSSHHPGSDARGRRRGRGDGHAVWNSYATGGKPHPGEQRTCRRKRSVQRCAFVANRADDRSAFRQTNTIVDLAPIHACCGCSRDRAHWQFLSRGFSRLDRGHGKYLRSQPLAQPRWLYHRRSCFRWHIASHGTARQEEDRGQRSLVSGQKSGLITIPRSAIRNPQFNFHRSCLLACFGALLDCCGRARRPSLVPRTREQSCHDHRLERAMAGGRPQFS